MKLETTQYLTLPILPEDLHLPQVLLRAFSAHVALHLQNQHISVERVGPKDSTLTLGRMAIGSQRHRGYQRENPQGSHTFQQDNTHGCSVTHNNSHTEPFSSVSLPLCASVTISQMNHLHHPICI